MVSVQGLSRLKGFFRAGINYHNYSALTNGAKRTVVGNLPKDLLGLIIERTPKALRGGG